MSQLTTNKQDLSELTLDKAYLFCRNLTRNNAKNFYLAFQILPWIKRRSIYSIYAFCRCSDDLVDDPAIKDRAGLLEKWKVDLAACYRGEIKNDPIFVALYDTVKRYSIPKKYFLELIEGMEMDISVNRYETFDELYEYAYKAASVVGLILIEIFGYKNYMTREYAKNLGIAMQLTNIIRDVKEDAKRGRIYLPREDMIRFGYSEKDLFANEYGSKFVRLMEYQVARAVFYYQKATRSIPPEDRNLLTSPEIMKNIYFHLLNEIVGKGYNIFHNRIQFSNLTKLFIAVRTWFRIQLQQQ